MPDKNYTTATGVTLQPVPMYAVDPTTGLAVVPATGSGGGGATPAGANLIGSVGIDQTTPGTTNRVAVTDSSGVSQFNFPAGFVRTSDEPRQVFYDPFDAALDTVNLWQAPTTGNSAVAASTTAGTMTLETGTTASGWSKLISQPSFKPAVPAWLGFSFANALPDGAAPVANAYRFWGAGNPAAVPTPAAPMVDAVGFEIATTGKMYAVTYAAGVRTQIADLSSSGTSKQPLDAAMHRYIVYVRTDKIFFYIDGLANANLVATANFQGPSVQTLPLSFVAAGFSTPPASSAKIQSAGLAVWDTGKNASGISDGTFPWRKMTVNAAGAASVSLGAGVARTAAMATFTTSGSVAAGAKNASFYNSGTAAATVAGGSLAPGASVFFSTTGPDTLAAIAYVASATAILQISTVI